MLSNVIMHTAQKTLCGSVDRLRCEAHTESQHRAPVRFVYQQFHPSIFLHVSGIRFQWQQVQRGISDIPLPSNTSSSSWEESPFIYIHIDIYLCSLFLVSISETNPEILQRKGDRRILMTTSTGSIQFEGAAAPLRGPSACPDSVPVSLSLSPCRELTELSVAVHFFSNHHKHYMHPASVSCHTHDEQILLDTRQLVPLPRERWRWRCCKILLNQILIQISRVWEWIQR